MKKAMDMLIYGPLRPRKSSRAQIILHGMHLTSRGRRRLRLAISQKEDRNYSTPQSPTTHIHFKSTIKMQLLSAGRHMPRHS